MPLRHKSLPLFATNVGEAELSISRPWLIKYHRTEEWNFPLRFVIAAQIKCVILIAGVSFEQQNPYRNSAGETYWGLNYLISKAAANIILHPGGQLMKTNYAMLLKFNKLTIREDSFILRKHWRRKAEGSSSGFSSTFNVCGFCYNQDCL